MRDRENRNQIVIDDEGDPIWETTEQHPADAISCVPDPVKKRIDPKRPNALPNFTSEVYAQSLLLAFIPGPRLRECL
jgi:hypothetical protein